MPGHVFLSLFFLTQQVPLTHPQRHTTLENTFVVR